MLSDEIKPYANEIWNYGKTQIGANLISISKQKLMYTLLPRTSGKFTRSGLKVNKMRYYCEGFTEQYLKGGEVLVAYNPDDSTKVWIVEKGEYIEFELIESRFKNKSISEIENLKKKQKSIVRAERMNNDQAQIDLARHIPSIPINTL